MTPSEARALLDASLASGAPSRLNPNLTEAQAVSVIRAAIDGARALAADGVHLNEMMEKRVHQVTRNQRRPRY